MAVAYKENSLMLVSGHPGTSNVVISGAVPGSQKLGGGDDGQVFSVLFYVIDATGQSGSGLWEVQTSTWTNSSNTLSRLSGGVTDGSSGAGTLVNFTAGTLYARVLYKLSTSSSNTPNAVVQRDGSGNFASNIITVAEVTSGGTTPLKIDTHYGVLHSNTDGSTVTFDMSVSNKHTVTLGASRTLALSHDQDNQAFLVALVQGGSGSNTVIWWSGILWPDGTAPTLTTTNGKRDVFGFIRLGSGSYLGFVIGQNL